MRDMNSATIMTSSLPVFLPSSLVLARVDHDVADLLDEGGAKGYAINFWAVLDHSRDSVRACMVELYADGEAHLLAATTREFFPSDLILIKNS